MGNLAIRVGNSARLRDEKYFVQAEDYGIERGFSCCEVDFYIKR